MRKIFKKFSAVCLGFVMVISLAACGNAGGKDANEGQTGSKTDTEETQNSDTSKDGAKGEVQLTLWSIATESDSFNHAYTQAIADYEAAHPGVKIVHETFENESYKTKIKSAVAANELPDLFYTWGGGFSKSFVASGKVMPLDKYYTEDYKAQLPQAALSNATYDSVLYGSTYTTPVSALFYNKAMFDKYGLKAPATWEELVKVCQTFLDNGITPFGVSVKDTWVLAMAHDALTLKSAGPTKTAAAVTKNGVSYKDPDFLASAAKIKELVDMGAFLEGATGLSNDEASANFYNGTVPMYITGSWMGGSILTDATNPEDFDVAPIPVINSNNAKITDFMGGAADTIMVSQSTKYPDEAGNAVFELTKSISKYAYLDGAGIAAWKVDYDDSSVNPITKKVAEYASGATSFTLWFDTLMDANDAGEYLALLQELYTGNLSPEEFVEAMASQLQSK
ncbi:extracellular solute-binding protein [Anaerocolumna sp. MB42-C2]|uniref:extracellular solute-binding protein n=1 Tax=Anaerocolumna sp. MB42-C2 TaxID=3070997 RepID=UPI0027E0D024|nr:extracellular solute-binding protein [Anaerocolumna sp. MB42-C2]WMJ90573.1 extracellular solute-binding protein [Anaerocolumna sp. MB42-C2]